MDSTEEPEYLSIPIPPARPIRKSRRRLPKKAKRTRSKATLQSPPRKTGKIRKQRVEWLHAVLAALIINIVIALLLSFLNTESSDLPELTLTTVSLAPPDDEPRLQQSRLKRSEKKTSQPQVSASSHAIVANTISPIPLPDFHSPTFDDLPLGWDDFGSANGGGNGSGSGAAGFGTVGAVFDNAGITNGSDLLLFIDISPSMSKHSQEVADLVRKRFPRASVLHISGCKFVPGKGIVSRLPKVPVYRTKIFYVCDLYDQVTEEGLLLLMRRLKYPVERELHIISFKLEPKPALRSVIEATNGSFSMFSK